MNKYLSSIFCSIFLVISACPRSNNPIPNNTPSNILPSDSNIQNNKVYLPLKVMLNLECTTQKGKLAYEIKEDGTFSFVDTPVSGDNQLGNLVTRQLTSNEIIGLNQLLKKNDIISLANKSTLEPSGTPQTDECRTIENYNFTIDGKDKSFDLNGRNIIHSSDYLEYLNSIKNYLEQLKKNQTPSTSKYTYDFPLRLNSYNECSLGVTSKTAYQINQDGKFYYADPNNTSNTENLSRILSTQELSEVKDLLLNLDIAQLAEKDVKNSSSTPQTTDCREVKEISLLVNNKNIAFDFNGKVFTHSYEYQTALNKLETKLSDLKDKKPDAVYSTHYYGLPLKVNPANECISSIQPSLYEIYESGSFNYKNTSTGKIEYKTLPIQEITDFKNLLKKLDIANLAKKDIQDSSDSIQTTDCKNLNTFSFIVDGKNTNFSLNNRNVTHTQDYISALNSISSYLKRLTTSIPTPSPTPTPTPTPVSTVYYYALPIKVTSNSECGLGDTTNYEITTDGYFSYANSAATDGFSVNPIVSRKLSTIEIKYINEIVKNLNIASLAEKDKFVSSSGNITGECRVIKNFAINVNGLKRTYDVNGRIYTHSTEYLTALSDLESALKVLKN
ncbi:MAG: hypothetical protein AABZ74_07670 [Cyanobacteriota bacterium]|mgnify:CR=1 FL=1